MFMEYCDRGTVDEVSRVGLTEDLSRLYTKQLLKAVQVLHDNKIVHRDIKGTESLIHYDSIITGPSGSNEKTCYNGPHYIHTRPFKIFNATSFTGFHIRKQMLHTLSFGMGHQLVYLVLWL